ncbi:MAG: hypothetical protein H0W88_11430 [Parachlamydiaceae bacterium]|nr:hypothetical protein [Parachlamydiaceae bacterium]
MDVISKSLFAVQAPATLNPIRKFHVKPRDLLTTAVALKIFALVAAIVVCYKLITAYKNSDPRLDHATQVIKRLISKDNEPKPVQPTKKDETTGSNTTLQPTTLEKEPKKILPGQTQLENKETKDKTPSEKDEASTGNGETTSGQKEETTAGKKETSAEDTSSQSDDNKSKAPVSPVASSPTEVVVVSSEAAPAKEATIEPAKTTEPVTATVAGVTTEVSEPKEKTSIDETILATFIDKGPEAASPPVVPSKDVKLEAVPAAEKPAVLDTVKTVASTEATKDDNSVKVPAGDNQPSSSENAKPEGDKGQQPVVAKLEVTVPGQVVIKEAAQTNKVHEQVKKNDKTKFEGSFNFDDSGICNGVGTVTLESGVILNGTIEGGYVHGKCTVTKDGEEIRGEFNEGVVAISTPQSSTKTLALEIPPAVSGKLA